MSGYWDILIPETCTNMVLNPVGGDTDNVTAESSGTLTSKVTTYSYLGAYCHRLVGAGDNQGMSYTLSALTNAIHYMTLRIHTASDVATFDCSLDNSTYTEPTLLSTEGDWWVYGIQFPAAQANASVKLYIRQKGASAAIDLYLGHAQVEAKEYPTTPVTGDLKNCYWTGAKNKSTSVRPAWDRSGGRVYDLDTQYGMYLATYPGIGSPEMERYQTALSLLPGSLDDGHKVLPREFTLVGEQTGTSWANMHYKRKNLIDVLKPDHVKGDQPVTLRYRGANTSRPVEIKAFYLGGMEFTEHEGFTTKQAVRLRANDPYWYDPYETAAHLTVSQTFTASYGMYKHNGAWANINVNFNDDINAILKTKNNEIFLGGDFSNVGDANGDAILKFNPETGAITSLSTGIPSGLVYDMAEAPDGSVYVAGNFINITDANGDYITKWNGTAFSSLSTGLTTDCNALAIGQDGTLYLGGSFLNITDANGDYITKWNGTAFSSLGTGMNGIVYDLAIAPNGDLYACGAFTAAGGVTVNGVAKWNGTAWSALGTGLDTDSVLGYTLAIDAAGNVYVGGNFVTAGGVTVNNIAKWNGSAWEALGSGLGDVLNIQSIAITSEGYIYAAGPSFAAGGPIAATSMAIWNGSSWIHAAVVAPSGAIVQKIFTTGDDIYLGLDLVGTAVSSYVNTVTNNGTARAYPKMVIKCNSKDTTGNAYATYLENITTGYKIWFNYALLSGETLEINFDPQNLTCKSDFFGDRWDAVLRGSDIADFYLLPGSNSVSAFVNSTTDASVTSYLLWRNAYESAEGGSTA